MSDFLKDPQQLKENGGDLGDVMDIFKGLLGGGDNSSNSGGLSELLSIMGKE
jgi:hypothetical protein